MYIATSMDNSWSHDVCISTLYDCNLAIYHA